jgi:hypothetical protein
LNKKYCLFQPTKYFQKTHHKDLVFGFKHALQLDNSGVIDCVQDCNLALERLNSGCGGLFGKSVFCNYLNRKGGLPDLKRKKPTLTATSRLVCL